MGKVLTIGRQFGSNGRLIAKNAAKALGVKFYDKELIGMAADRSNLAKEDLAEIDETRANPWFYSSVGYSVGSGYQTTVPINDVLFQAESEVIREIADKEDCIIVGRCSNYVLRRKIDVRHIFIYAPLEVRIETIANRKQLDSRGAEALIKKVDKRRRLYYNFYTDMKWGNISDYDLLIDSSTFSTEDVTQLLIDTFNTMD